MYRDNEFLWVEKYRPKTIEECILPEGLKDTFLGVIKEGNIPNLLLFGSAGCGKTTVARALCEQLDNDNILINGSLGAEESGIEAVRTRIKGFASAVSFNGNRKVIIIDEADYLNPNSSQPALRSLIEEFSSNCAFIFTCNYKNRIIEPIHSRCSNIEFKIAKSEKPKIITQFLKKIMAIFELEGVTCTDKKVVLDLIVKYYPDFRRTINELQKFAITHDKKIDEGILAKHPESDLNFDELCSALKQKSFENVRKWAVNSLSEEPARLYRKIYDSLNTKAKKQSLPALIVLIADYQYKAAFCLDQEINLLAFLIEIMVNDSIEFV
jgi:DNA polymerase III delta prime subunit